jgi:Ca2+-binding RTX toxin-like protein
VAVNVINPPDGYTGGTSQDDTFTVTDRGGYMRVLDGLAGYDSLYISRSFEVGTAVRVADTFGNGSFDGRVSHSSGYESFVDFFNMENVRIVGSSGNDSYSLEVRPSSAALNVQFDAGEGADSLLFDFRTFTQSVSFAANLEVISSSYGQFAGFEIFTIHGGAGDDVIRTRDGNDTLWGGLGTNILDGGNGDDGFYSTSLTDWSDGGAGHDFWQANWSTASAALSIEIGSDVELFGTVVATNMEAIQVGAGKGNDVINITKTGSVYVYGGAGNDILISDISADQVENFLVNATTLGTLLGNANGVGFQDIESVVFTGGNRDDTFRVLGIFSSNQINFDGGAGMDSLVAQFESLAESTTFVVNSDGTITSNRGQFSGFETFTVTGGDGNDTLIGGEGNDSLSGRGGDDTVDGKGGDDFLIVSGTGIDIVDGGTGIDTLFIDYQNATAAIFTAGPGNTSRPQADASGFSGSFTDSLASPSSSATFQNIDRFSIITGSGADTIVTAAGNDQVASGSGDDFVDVGAGDDIAHGGIGFDVISADLSQATTDIIFDVRYDIYFAEVGSFTNFEAFGTLKTGSGNDWIVTSVDRSLGGGAFTSTSETVDVGGGDDTVTHYSGADGVTGGSGFDTLIVDYSGKTGFVSWEATDVTPGDLASGYKGIFRNDSSGSRVTYTGIEAFVITVGNGASATIRTGRANDIITTGDGFDVITPGGGNDVVNAGAGGDRIDYSQNLIGAETGTVGVVLNLSGADFVVPAGHPNAGATVAAGEAIDNFGDRDTLIGIEHADTSAQNDILIGGSAQNFFNAGAGDDRLIGGGGVDSLNGGDGIDTADYSTETGTFGIIVNMSGFFLNPPGRNLFSSLGPGEALDSYNNRETLLGIENVVTGSLDDWVFGSTDRNVIHTKEGNDRINGNGGNDELNGGAGDDDITGDAGDDLLIGEAGNDILNGGAGIDTMSGGTGDDIYFVDNVADAVTEDAGEGTADDIRTTLTSYSIAALPNIERLAGLGNVNQTLTGNDADNLISGGLGADTMIGGTGNDIYIVDDAGDVVTEQAGEGDADEVRTSVASYQLPDYVEKLTYTGSAGASLRGNSADNMLVGGTGVDAFYFQDGGDDAVWAGAGDDGIYFGAAYTAADRVDGGSGSDVVVLQGNYTVTMGADSLVDVEYLSVQSGASTRFGDLAGNTYNYDVTLLDANVKAGQRFAVNGSSLGAGETFTFNGSAETDGYFLIYGGYGTDLLTAGAGNDGFHFEGTRWGANDVVDGGSGSDVLIIRGVAGMNTVVLGDAQLRNMEAISVSDRYALSSGGLPSYDLTLANGNVAPGGTLIVNGNSLLNAGQVFKVDGSAVQNGSLRLYSGAGDDTLIGGAGDDILWGAGGTDSLSGGSGSDTFQVRRLSDSAVDNADSVLDFTSGIDKIDLRLLDANAGVAGDQSFTFIGSNAFGGGAGELRAYDTGSGYWRLEGDVDGDGMADFALNVTLASQVPLASSDFIA